LVVRHKAEEAEGIKDLAGIEYATNLKKLFLYDNPIRDLSPLHKLKNLKGMDISGKYIVDISPLASLKNLEWLGLGDTQVTDISPLTALNNLECLSLSSNRIRDISPLSKLTKLKDLAFSYNQVRDISALSALKRLESLRVHHNHISDISALSGLSSLRELDLSNNQIRDISPLVHLTSLEYLKIYNNPLNKEAYRVYFPRILKDNPHLRVMADRNVKPQISKIHLMLYLGTLSLLALFGLLVIFFGRKTMVFVERTDIARSVKNNNSTNQRRRISTLALESLGFAVSALILVGLCGGFSLSLQAFYVTLFAFGSSIAAMIMAVISLFRIKKSHGVLIGNKQACCGALLSVVSLWFCIVSLTYLR